MARPHPAFQCDESNESNRTPAFENDEAIVKPSNSCGPRISRSGRNEISNPVRSASTLSDGMVPGMIPARYS